MHTRCTPGAHPVHTRLQTNNLFPNPDFTLPTPRPSQANNLFPWDLSGTNRYQRDSLLGLLHYITNFCLHTFLYLPYYAVAKRRFGLAALSMCSMGESLV